MLKIPYPWFFHDMIEQKKMIFSNKILYLSIETFKQKIIVEYRVE